MRDLNLVQIFSPVYGVEKGQVFEQGQVDVN